MTLLARALAAPDLFTASAPVLMRRLRVSRTTLYRARQIAAPVETVDVDEADRRDETFRVQRTDWLVLHAGHTLSCASRMAADLATCRCRVGREGRAWAASVLAGGAK